MTLRLDRAIQPDAALPTKWGEFRISTVPAAGAEIVALTRGDLDGAEGVLARVHSECLTGDAFGSLRCDCGDQLRHALALIASEERGVLIYLDHEGRGIGIRDKIRAYALQDGGMDTVDANTALGRPVDARDYRAAAEALQELGVRSVRLITNNPAKVAGLIDHGIEVLERVPLKTLPDERSAAYLRTKARRMGHLLDLIPDLEVGRFARADRPHVTVHFAQTLDGRIASRTGDARWVSGQRSLELAHQLRAAHDAVLVGIGTVLTDDPRLTVRLVPGPSPMRVIVDSSLRLPVTANVLSPAGPPTIVATTSAASPDRERDIAARGGRVLRVSATADGRVDLRAALARLRAEGVGSVLIEGGRGIITSALRERLVDHLTVCIAPKVIGEGISAVGDLDIAALRDAITFGRSGFMTYGEDVVFYGEPAA